MLPIKAKLMNESSTTKTTVPDWAALMTRVAQHGDKQAFRDIYNYFAPRIKA